MAHDTDIDRIKAKISKLLKLAEGSANEHEAANAMGKARSLMDKYQLTKIDIIEVDGVAKEFKAAQATRAFKACPKHIQWLATSIAKFNDCQAIFENGHEINFKKNDNRVHAYGKIIVFCGYSLDVDICVEMFARTVSAVNRLCAIFLAASGHEGRYPMGIGNAFKQGCADKIGNRLSELKIERQKLTTASGTSLVVVKDNAVSEYFGSVKYKSSCSRKLDSESFKAYEAGIKAGDEVELQKKIEESSEDD